MLKKEINAAGTKGSIYLFGCTQKSFFEMTTESGSNGFKKEVEHFSSFTVILCKYTLHENHFSSSFQYVLFNLGTCIQQAHWNADLTCLESKIH